MSLTGFPGDPPTKTFFPLIDRITALHATIGALAALHERSLSGRGQTIDVSLADSGFTANEIPIAAYLADGTVVEREGNGRGLTNVYRTKGRVGSDARDERRHLAQGVRSPGVGGVGSRP